MSCIRGRFSLCKYPYDNITLIEDGVYEFLRGGQGYAVEVVLEMPESERNFNQGMFMIKLDMLDHTGAVIQSSLRPALLHYRSPVFKLIYTIFFVPGLLAGSVEEKQYLTIPLFEKYIENSHKPTHAVHLEVQAQYAEVYSSSLQIHAQFTGLRYLMYYWPITSAIVGIGGHFLFMLSTILMIWLRETMKSETEQEVLPPMAVKKEGQRHSKKRQFSKHTSGLSRDSTPERTTEASRRVKSEIDNLTAYCGTFHKHKKEKPRDSKENDETNEEFFDIENLDLPSTSLDSAENPCDMNPGILRQRIKQVLGKKDLN